MLEELVNQVESQANISMLLLTPSLVPYFNGDGRYLYAIVALGVEKARDRSFYCCITESVACICTVSNPIQDMKEDNDNDKDMDCDSGAENLDIMVI